MLLHKHVSLHVHRPSSTASWQLRWFTHRVSCMQDHMCSSVKVFSVSHTVITSFSGLAVIVKLRFGEFPVCCVRHCTKLKRTLPSAWHVHAVTRECLHLTSCVRDCMCSPCVCVCMQSAASCSGPSVTLELQPHECLLEEKTKKVTCKPAQLVLIKTPGKLYLSFKARSCSTAKCHVPYHNAMQPHPTK